MNDEFPLIVIVLNQTCSILMLSVISTLHHAPLFMDRIWLLLVPVETISVRENIFLGMQKLFAQI